MANTEIDFHFADGIFVKSLVVGDGGTMVPQHAHQFDHVTFVAAGQVMAWKNGSFLGTYRAPAGILIEAGAKHAFLTQEPGTTLLCIHNLHDEKAVHILAEHQLTLDDVRAFFAGELAD